MFFFATTIFIVVFILFLFQGSGLEKQFLSTANLSNILDKTQYLSFNETLVAGNTGVSIIGENFLKQEGPPFLVEGKVLGAAGVFSTKREIEEYIIENGDTLAGIAQKFEISLETLLWANDLSQNSVIQPGKKLVILPVSGVLHIIRERDTISELGQIYSAKSADIIEFNELSEEGDIYVGDILIIPDGKKPAVYQRYSQVPIPGSYFICPIPSPCRITQGLHWFNAIDFSNGKCGDPVFAAAGGTIQRVGYGSVSGYYVRVLHPNGVVTFYGHLSRAIVVPGQTVYQGQIIGYVGYSGLTVPPGPAGCHLHFDVRFAKNPFSGYLVGTQFGK